MFRHLRLKLVLAYVGLSTFVYLLLIGLAVTLFHSGLTTALDQELAEVSNEVLPVIDDDDFKPNLGVLPTKLQAKPIRQLACIVLFDKDEKAITHVGGPGIQTLEENPGDYSTGDYKMRILTTELYNDDDELIGYLQVELPTSFRENSTKQFAMSLLTTTPVLLLAMSLAGYLFSGVAMRPIEDSIKLLRRFLEDANHELKTPIAITQATLENLQRDLGEDDKHKARLEVLFRNVGRMDRLTQDMLFLARAESGQFSKNLVNLHLRPLVKQVVNDFLPLYEGKAVTLEMGDIPDVDFMGESHEFQRVLSNLLDNALRHTAQGGKVKVFGTLRGKHVALSVADTGVGIPKESLPQLFDRFYRVDMARARKEGGSGLGLAIAKAIVESFAGTIEVHSVEKQGTTFTVTLPICNPAVV